MTSGPVYMRARTSTIGCYTKQSDLRCLNLFYSLKSTTELPSSLSIARLK